LIREGHYVTALDNLYSGSKANIESLLTNANFEFIEHDVRVPIDLVVDGIFNLACPASPVHYQRNPVQTIKTSLLGSLNLLDLAMKTNSRVLQASTSEVYGDPEVNPQSEEYAGRVNPIGIRACYDEVKRAAETLIFDYHLLHQLDIRVARIFNTYGPKMALDDGRVVTNFITQAINDAPITIYGDGSQTRSFCYVDDLIDGLVKLFFTAGVYQPINLGNPVSVSMKTLGEEIISMAGSKSVLEYKPLPSDDPKLREPDITKAKSILNWSPQINRAEGLERTYKSILARMK
jgi:UDP-glucuronate decarboxylase